MNLESNIQFLKALSVNNHKPWMDEHKKWYEEEKEKFQDFVKEILAGLSESDPGFSVLTPKDCIFRLNRDIRFSKNKSPYKTNFGASFSIGGKKSNLAGYYIHIENEQSFVGGGMWMPEAESLRMVRQEIDYNFNEFEKIVTEHKFVKKFETLKGDRLVRPPKGYEADNPAINYLKHKSFIVSSALSNAEVADKKFTAHCLQSFKIMQPFINFLNKAID